MKKNLLSLIPFLAISLHAGQKVYKDVQEINSDLVFLGTVAAVATGESLDMPVWLNALIAGAGMGVTAYMGKHKLIINGQDYSGQSAVGAGVVVGMLLAAGYYCVRK